MPTALITGSSRGIGKATAKLFANSGWDLLLTSRSESSLSSLSEELSQLGQKINYRAIDLSNQSEIRDGLTDLISKGSVPSVLINNAGIAWTGELLSMPTEEWNLIFQMNLTSVFQVCSVVVPEMRRNGGLLINVSSHASRNAFPQWGAYCATKAALESLTKCIAVEERSNGIRACTLTLGAVNTPLWDSDSVKSDFDRNAMLTPEHAAKALLHLAEQPISQVIEDLTLMPSSGAF